MLDLVGLPRPREQLDPVPARAVRRHAAAGGDRRGADLRAARLLIADEPTTALDVTTQAQILELFDRLRQTLGMAMLLITHDMGVVAGHADRVFVMYAGREAETGPTAEVFDRPSTATPRPCWSRSCGWRPPRKSALYTIPGRPPDLTADAAGLPVRAALPGGDRRAAPATFPPAGWPERGRAPLALLPPGAASRQLAPRSRRPSAMTAAHAVRRTRRPRPPRPPPLLRPGRGDQACTAAAGCWPGPTAPGAGGVRGEPGRRGGQPRSASSASRAAASPRSAAWSSGWRSRPRARSALRGTDLAAMTRAQRRAARYEIQMMFQDPYAALNPRMSLARIIEEPLRAQGRQQPPGTSAAPGSGSWPRRSAWPPASWTATRASCPAASGSGSAWPGRWPPARR